MLQHGPLVEVKKAMLTLELNTTKINI